LIAATFRLDYARYMLPLLPVITIGIGIVGGLAWSFVTSHAHVVMMESRASNAMSETAT